MINLNTLENQVCYVETLEELGEEATTIKTKLYKYKYYIKELKYHVVDYNLSDYKKFLHGFKYFDKNRTKSLRKFNNIIYKHKNYIDKYQKFIIKRMLNI